MCLSTDGEKRMEIDENDPRNLRAGGRTRPRSLEERQTEALESIAESLATIAGEIIERKKGDAAPR